MIKTKTVLVLGAGASMPFGFPSRVTLRDEIRDSLRKGHLIGDMSDVVGCNDDLI